MYRKDLKIFIAHPKTGSTSVRDAIVDDGWEAFQGHHYIQDNKLRVVLQRDGQVYCTKRNMFQVMRSWWFTQAVLPSGERTGPWKDFDEFVFWACFKSDLTWFKTNLYHFGLPWATRVVPFEEAPEFYAKEFGLYQFPHRHKSPDFPHYRDMFSADSREYVEARYKQDLMLTGYSY